MQNNLKTNNDAKNTKTGCIGCLIIIIILIVGISLFFNNSNNTEKENNNNKTSSEEKIQEPQPNTSSMVDYLISQGKNDVETVAEEDLTDALDYISNNIDNLFENNETMENVIYYGSLLEYYYAIDNDPYNGFTDTRGEIGMDAVQAVKGVYRNVESPQDQHVIENINQIKENLA